MSTVSDDVREARGVSTRIIFWVMGILGTFVLTIGGVMVGSMMGMNTSLAEVRTEMRLSREGYDKRLSSLESDVKELRERQAAESALRNARYNENKP